MAEEQVEQTEVTQQVEAPAQNDASLGDTSVEAAKPAADPVIDWSFKFNDETKEVPEDYRWVKEPDKAAKLKELYQSSEAVKYHKEQTSTLQNKLSGFETQLSEYEPIVTQVKQLQEWYGKGDHTRVLESLGYGKDKILELAKGIIDAEKMPPEQRQLYEQNRQAQLAQEELSKQNEYYRQTAERQMASLTAMQLDSELGKASVQEVASVYDSKFGPGKFREMVISQGEATVARLGRHVPPHELVPQVVAQYAPFVSTGGLGTQTPSGALGSEGSLKTSGGPEASKAKVIPNVRGTSAAIGGSAISSISDLKKIRNSLGG
jgi:hypothetical protein